MEKIDYMSPSTPETVAGKINLDAMSDDELDKLISDDAKSAIDEWVDYSERMKLFDAERDERIEENRKVKTGNNISDQRKEEIKQFSQRYAESVRAMGNKGSIAWFNSQINNARIYRKPLLINQEYKDSMFLFLNTAYQDIVINEEHCKMDYNQLYETVIKDMSRWCLERNKFGLMLIGNVGVGKTTLMKAICKCYLILANAKVRIMTADKIAMLAKQDQNEYNDLMNCPLLGIDDLGTEPKTVKIYGNDVNPLVDLLTHRYDKKLFTIITTNLTKDEIAEYYGERVWDRLVQLCNKYTFNGETKSYRR